ncbi:MAG TPA: PepSY domain-containing protein [Gammaproteobacteria bacterium]
MKIRELCGFAAASIVLISGTVAAQDRDVPIADVPATVLAAARAAVPGLVITSAEVEVEDGQDVYEIEGTADGMEYEIEISVDGEVLEIEADD